MCARRAGSYETEINRATPRRPLHSVVCVPPGGPWRPLAAARATKASPAAARGKYESARRTAVVRHCLARLTTGSGVNGSAIVLERDTSANTTRGSGKKQGQTNKGKQVHSFQLKKKKKHLVKWQNLAKFKKKDEHGPLSFTWDHGCSISIYEVVIFNFKEFSEEDR